MPLKRLFLERKNGVSDGVNRLDSLIRRREIVACDDIKFEDLRVHAYNYATVYTKGKTFFTE